MSLNSKSINTLSWQLMGRPLSFLNLAGIFKMFFALQAEGNPHFFHLSQIVVLPLFPFLLLFFLPPLLLLSLHLCFFLLNLLAQKHLLNLEKKYTVLCPLYLKHQWCIRHCPRVFNYRIFTIAVMWNRLQDALL